MAIVVLIVAAMCVVAVAFVAVGFAVGKTESMPPQIVVDAHEAISFCAEALPDAVTAVITYEDLRKVLRLHLEWIQAFHLSPEGGATNGDDRPIVFEEFDAVGYILERADVNHFDIDGDHVAAIVEAHSSYLQVMGAIHLEDPVAVEADLAELPLLDLPELDRSTEGELE